MINESRLLGEFLEITSISAPSKGEQALCEVLFAKLAQLGMNPVVDKANSVTGGDTGNLWGLLKGNAPGVKSVLFTAHMDSVEPTMNIRPVVREGIIYSDGQSTLGGDDKSGIAAILEAVRVIKENNLPHGDVQVLFTISEEIGCLGSVNLDKTMLAAEFGYALDMGGKPGKIVTKAAQQYNIDFVIKGKTAHGGVDPENGVNAIMLACQALAKLTSFGRIDEETTLNIGTIQGGKATNIVPDEVHIGCDARSLNKEKLEAVVNNLVQVVTSTVAAGGGQVESTVQEGCPLIGVEESSSVVQLALKAAEELGLPTEVTSTGGGSDANFLNGQGLPCVILATGMDKIHTTAEQLAIEDLNNTARWTVAIIEAAAKGC